jgi:hypothetical protein
MLIILVAGGTVTWYLITIVFVSTCSRQLLSETHATAVECRAPLEFLYPKISECHPGLDNMHDEDLVLTCI